MVACEINEGRKAIDCNWVFRVKQNVDGEIDHYKMRLVAKGYSQVVGFYYKETFTPITRYSSI
jgi:hypothetical protein